jgi:hypothetical protein
MSRAYLELSRDGRAETVSLGGRLTIGSAPENDLVLPPNPALSAVHAVFERVFSGWQVRDLGSSSGTYLNGRPVDGSSALRGGDRITVGGTNLVFWLEVEPAAAPPAAPPPAVPPTVVGGYLDASDEWGSGSAHHRPRAAEPSREVGHEPVRATGPVLDRGPAYVRGAARGVSDQLITNEGFLLTFRVERYDSAGNRMHPVAVELRAGRSGRVSEGDEVEVTGKWSKGTVKADKIVNVSTGSEVLGPHAVTKAAPIVCGTIVIGFILFIFVLLILAFLFGGG